jgi:hypothetical protein
MRLRIFDREIVPQNVPNSPKLFRGGQHLVGAGSHSDVLGEVSPPSDLGGVDEKFCGPCDVVRIRAACRVQQMILANHCRVGIRKDEKGIPGFVSKITRNLRRIDTDGYRTYARRLKLRQTFLDAS